MSTLAFRSPRALAILLGATLVACWAAASAGSKSASAQSAVRQPPITPAAAAQPSRTAPPSAPDVRTRAPALRERGATPTLTVAAANTPADKRALADFVCDGMHDEEEIQAALDVFGEYQSNPWGGVVELMRGIYYIGAPISFRGARTLRGEGVRGTVLWLADGANCNMIEYRVRPNQAAKENFSHIEKLYLYGNKAHNTVGNGIYTQRADPNQPSTNRGLWDTNVRDVNIMSFPENGLRLEEVWGWVIDSVIVEFCGLKGLSVSGTSGKISNCKLLQNGESGLFVLAVAGLLATNLELDAGVASSGYGALCITHSVGIHVANCSVDSVSSTAVWLRGNTRQCSFVNVSIPAGPSGTTALKLSTYEEQTPYDNSFANCDFATAGIPVDDAGGRNHYANNRGFVTEVSSARQVAGAPDGTTVFTVTNGLGPHVPPNMTRHFQIVPTNAEMAQAEYYVSNPDPDGTGTLVEITFLSPPPVRCVLTFELLARLQRSD